jgi:thymidylate synthase (FAD)
MEISLDAEMLYHATIRNALTTYDLMIKEGVAPEQARAILPQNMMTSWYWSGSLDAWARMCNLRLKDDTQHETTLVAEQIDQRMLGLFPVSWEALVYGEGDD